jgi:exodeoxyribonuclease VII small subunit
MKEKFEDLLNELNNIVTELENGDLSLEDSIKKYQRGIELSNLCKNKLTEAKEVVVKNMNEGK